ncbi:protoheme IX farnesyltransferase [Pseudonocardia ammonioxydans]|uniref:Protoheme IX farnesyltransferase n=1 Tax=Pseudonocardia ammonioxydans TaxID=260086 RepID=A0A1I5HUJ0_PSUAM|nr:protoheme IX farnesyltransferase [Pseudonocardia ammonioxydans]
MINAAAAAVLALAAVLLYVVFYAIVLERRSWQNIIWGGLSGCMPVLIGGAAVTGSLEWAPVVLFLVIFFWTPAYYWPLSIQFRTDYTRAGVPMLPVVAGEIVVDRQVVLYTAATIATTLLLVPVAGTGWFYAGLVAAAGAWFLRDALRLYRRAPSRVRASRLR